MCGDRRRQCEKYIAYSLSPCSRGGRCSLEEDRVCQCTVSPVSPPRYFSRLTWILTVAADGEVAMFSGSSTPEVGGLAPERGVSGSATNGFPARASLPEPCPIIPQCGSQDVWGAPGSDVDSQEESSVMSSDVCTGCDVYTNSDEEYRRVRRREQNRRAAQRCRARRKLKEVAITQETEQELARMRCLELEACRLLSQNEALRHALSQHVLWVPGGDHSQRSAKRSHPVHPLPVATEVNEFLQTLKAENRCVLDEQQ